MTRDDSQSCLAFSEEHSCMAFQSFIACIASMERFNLRCQQLLKLSPRLSFIPIQLQVYILELLHSHFIKLEPRLDSKRNRRWRRLETKPVEIITKHCLLLFAPSIKQYSRNRIASKYQYHASAYSLQTICCRFIYLHEENANADVHGQLEQIARMNGKSYDRRSSTANQRNSSGRFRGHPT